MTWDTCLDSERGVNGRVMVGMIILVDVGWIKMDSKAPSRDSL